MSDSEFQRAVMERLTRIEHLLTGNGNPEKGIIVRVDRLEQNESRRAKYVGAAVGSAIAAVAAALWKLIAK